MSSPAGTCSALSEIPCSQGSGHSWIRAQGRMFTIASTTIFILFRGPLFTFSICCSSVPSLWSLLRCSIWFITVLFYSCSFVLHVFSYNTQCGLDIFKKSIDVIKHIHIFCSAIAIP